MHPKILLIILLCLPPFLTRAQTRIQGRTVDSRTGEPLAGIMITVSPVGEQAILAYAQSGEDGTFTLSRKEPFPARISVTAQSMITKTKSVEISPTDGPVELRLDAEVRQLDEVRIRAPRIEPRGDTLNYNVESFRDSTDRSIGDVLKKLPGIRVTSGGRILYQGNEISRFYVEGLDMLQGRYGLATNNLDASKVATVQVLEHHQPIKVLAGKELPESAAINIKLKKSALGAFFLTAQAGLGVPLWLLSNELIGMRFTETQQNMLVYKGDNTGRDIVQEMTSYYGAATGVSMDLFSPERPAAPAIDAQLTLHNDAHMGSINDLRMLGKGYTLTTNLNYLYDRQHSEGSHEQHVTVDGGTGDVHIAETLADRQLKRELSGTLTLEKNESDFYETNRLDFSLKDNSEESVASGHSPSTQRLSLPSFSIEDTYRRMKRRGTGTENYDARILYSRQDQHMDVDPVLLPDLAAQSPLARQQTAADRIDARLSYRRYWNLSDAWSFEISGGPVLRAYNLSSEMLSSEALVPVTADSLRNDFRRTEAGVAAQPVLRYRKGKYAFEFTVPTNILDYNRKDRIRQTGDDQWVSIFNPYLYATFYPHRRWTLNAGLSRRSTMGSFQDDMHGYLMSSYRRISRSDGSLQRSTSTGASLSANYRNPFTELYWSGYLSYTRTRQNTINEVFYNGILGSTSAIAYPNQGDAFSADMTLDMPLEKLRTDLKLGARYSRGSSMAMNQGLLSHYHADSYSLSPSFTTTLSRSLIFRYDAALSLAKNTVEGAASLTPIRNVSQSLSLSTLFDGGLSLTARLQHYYNSLLSVRPSRFFAGLSLRYKRSRTEYRLDWTNIFRTEAYETFSYSDVSSMHTSYRLRPSELLLRINFSIL